jgi:hypothetical protein
VQALAPRFLHTVMWHLLMTKLFLMLRANLHKRLLGGAQDVTIEC